MNQILMVEKAKREKGAPLDVETVVRIFAIAIMVFGIFMMASGVIALTTNQEEEEQNSNPVVTMEQQANKIIVNIKHDKAIDKIYYNWNSDVEQVLQGKGRNIIEEEIPVMIGTNVLHLRIIDIFGKETQYSKTYTIEEQDIISPEIEFTAEAPKIKITVRDETELAYMTYRWNDEDETKVEANENSLKIIEERIDTLGGINTLKVVAVDKAGNKTEKEQKFQGGQNPKISLEKQENNLMITVKADNEIQKIEYTLNGTLYSTDPQNTGVTLNTKEVSFPQPLAQGENKISITVTDIYGLTATQEATITV